MGYHKKIKIINKRKNTINPKPEKSYYGFKGETVTEMLQEKTDTDDYLGTNYTVEKTPIYYNEFITEDKKYRVVIDKRLRIDSKNMSIYFFTVYDNNFNMYKDYDPINNRNYRGEIIGLDFREHYINDLNSGEFLNFINIMSRIVSNISMGEYMLLPRPKSLGPNYCTNVVDHHLLYLRKISNINYNINTNDIESFIQPVYTLKNYAPMNYYLLDVNYFKTNRRLSKDAITYKDRNFIWTETIEFTPYDFHYKLLPMLQEAYMTR